jgi:hypothetical protein
MMVSSPELTALDLVRLPGDPWASTPSMIARFGLAGLD